MCKPSDMCKLLWLFFALASLSLSLSSLRLRLYCFLFSHLLQLNWAIGHFSLFAYIIYLDLYQANHRLKYVCFCEGRRRRF